MLPFAPDQIQLVLAPGESHIDAPHFLAGLPGWLMFEALGEFVGHIDLLVTFLEWAVSCL